MASYQITDNASVYTAVLMGILFSLKWLSEKNLQEAALFTDSLSSMRALESPKQNNHLVEVIKSLIQPGYKFSGIKAHIGHEGNELADRLAMEATTLPKIQLNCTVSIIEIKNEISKECLKIWCQRWEASDDRRATFNVFKTPKLNRLENDFHANQIITEHRFFGSHQANRYGKSVECSYCKQYQTASHLIPDCPHLSDIRQHYFLNFTSTKEWIDDFYKRKIAKRIMITAINDLLKGT